MMDPNTGFPGVPNLPPQPTDADVARALANVPGALADIARALNPVGDPRYPTHWAGRRITYRFPYVMPGEVSVPANSNLNFGPQANPFQFATDKPFEIHEVVFDACLLDGNGLPVADPAPSIHEWWRVSIQDYTRSQIVTQGAALVATLVTRQDRIWEWKAPYVIERSQGFLVNAQNLSVASQLRAAIAFRGFLLVLDR